MAAKTRGRPATYADLQALPPNVVGELVAGVLYASPRPAVPHAYTATTLGDDAKVRAEPFDAIELELGALWSK